MADAVWQNLRFDLVAFDNQDRAVLAVEVKAMTGAISMAIEWLSTLEAELRATGPAIPYWMFVDLDAIIVFTFSDSAGPARVGFQVVTEDALSPYDPEFGQKRIFDDYLLALVEAWLRDLASNRSSPSRVASQELSEIGLLKRLKGGTFLREVSLADLDPLRGNQLRHESLPGAGFLDGDFTH